MKPSIRLLASAVGIVVIMVGSTAGYALLEDQPLLDAAYMTVITIFTVGYGEHVPLDRAGRIWTMAVIIIGYGTVAICLANLVSLLVGGELRAFSGRLRMKAQIDQLKDHVIICGGGRMGSLIAADLKREGTPCVVVDRMSQDEMESRKFLCIRGDATEDDILLEAGVMRAKALVACLAGDADNVYVTLSARGLKPDLIIISRADQPESETKLKRAGADSVICPQTIGAGKAVALLLRPHVVDFVDMAARGVDIEIAQYSVPQDSSLVGTQLRDSGIGERADVIVVAIKRSDGSQIFSPGPDEVIRGFDQLVLIGRGGLSERLVAFRS